MNDNTNEKIHTGIETEITSAEKDAVQEAFDSIEPAEGAKARMYANILHKASAESERAQVTASTQEPEKTSSSPISIASSDAPVTRRRSTKAPLLRVTRWALPIAACLVLLVFGAIKMSGHKPVDIIDTQGGDPTNSPIAGGAQQPAPITGYGSSDELKKATGLYVQAPEGTEEVLYCSVGTDIAEVSFTVSGKQYTLRASKRDDDFSGLFGEEINHTVADKENGAVLTALRDEGITLNKIEWKAGDTNYVLMNTDGAGLNGIMNVYKMVK